MLPNAGYNRYNIEEGIMCEWKKEAQGFVFEVEKMSPLWFGCCWFCSVCNAWCRVCVLCRYAIYGVQINVYDVFLFSSVNAVVVAGGRSTMSAMATKDKKSR